MLRIYTYYLKQRYETVLKPNQNHRLRPPSLSWSLRDIHRLAVLDVVRGEFSFSVPLRIWTPCMVYPHA
jgi:hypothetical protein